MTVDTVWKKVNDTALLLRKQRTNLTAGDSLQKEGTRRLVQGSHVACSARLLGH